jgi:hypothetical protein
VCVRRVLRASGGVRDFRAHEPETKFAAVPSDGGGATHQKSEVIVSAH